MRNSVWIAVALLVVSLSACSSSEPMAVQITGPIGIPEGPSSLTGLAVDEGVICSAAMFEELRFEDADGKVLNEEETAQAQQVEMETGEMVIAVKYDRWTCTDGSGTFVTADRSKLAMPDMDFEGVNEAADWEIESGTGDYEDLTGSGTITVDFPQGTVVYSGEIQND
jgi:hypothetical protein